MTQIAEPRSAGASDAPDAPLTHQPLDRRRGRRRCVRPQRARCSTRPRASRPREVDFAVAGRGRRAPSPRPRRRSRRGGRRRCRSAPRSCSGSGDLLDDAPQGARRAAHAPSTARSRRTRWARSPAASRTSSSPAACPHLLKGGFSEQVSTGVDVYSIRQPLGVVAGITPFNFPAMVPMWMFANAIACGNTFVLKPSEKDPSASLLHRRAAEGGRAARRRVQRRPRRQGGGRSDPRAPRHRGRLVRRLDADRALHLRDRHPQRQAGPGARRGQEPHGRAARRRHRHGRRRGRHGGLRLGRRALHGDLGAGRRRRRRPTRSSRRSASGCPRSRSAPAPTRARRWARWSPASTATRSPATSTAAQEQGADVVVDGRERPGRPGPTASSSACR